MKNAIAVLIVSASLSAPVVVAKEVTRSDLYDSTFSVGYKTRDLGAGVNLDTEFNFSDNVGVYGSYHQISSDDRFSTADTLDRYGVGVPEDELFPREFSFDLSGIEYGVSLRHTFYNMLETPLSVYVKAGVATIDYDDITFSTADASSSSSDDSDTSSNDSNPEEEAVLSLSSIDSIKTSAGVKFFINNRTTFDVAYTQYSLDEGYEDQSSVDVEIGYFPRKNFGLSFMYESADITGESTYNIQGTVRW